MEPWPIPFLADYSFASPWFLLRLALVPVMMLLRGKRGPAPAVAYSPVRLLTGIARPAKSAFGRIMPALFYLTMISAVIALARPQRAF